VRTVRRTLVAALALAAIAAPAAQAEPTYSHDTPGKTAAPVERQDLRSPDARDAANARPDLEIDAPGATAVDSATRPGPAQPAASDDANGVDWPAIGVGIAGSLFVIGGIAALTRRIRRPQRVPV
jgi:hypothetical protein